MKFHTGDVTGHTFPMQVKVQGKLAWGAMDVIHWSNTCAYLKRMKQMSTPQAPRAQTPSQHGGLGIMIDRQFQYAGVATHGSMMQSVPLCYSIHYVWACTLLLKKGCTGCLPVYERIFCEALGITQTS